MNIFNICRCSSNELGINLGVRDWKSTLKDCLEWTAGGWATNEKREERHKKLMKIYNYFYFICIYYNWIL